MSETTTAIRLHQTGGPEVLAYEPTSMPEPGPGEIRLRVEAIGVGYGECLYRMGNYIQETRLPSSLGNHAVGTVEAVGEEPKIGQRISVIPSFQMNRYGAIGTQPTVLPLLAMIERGVRLKGYNPRHGAAGG
jgi:NADPH:quinone reductase-like Zn-dependent oxidoreductase